MPERPGPCIDKNCSECCNPVKVRQGFPENKIPLDEDGNKIWIRRDEIYLPENAIDRIRLEVFDCLKYDQETGKCTFYEKRPDICRNSSCVQDDSAESIDEQHRKTANAKYIICKKERKM